MGEKDLMAQIAELKVLAMKNAKPLFDEQIARCVAAIVVDISDGVILHSTPPANQLFGYVNGELDGMSIKTLMPERFRSVHDSHRLNYSKNPKERAMGEAAMTLWGITKSGQEFKIEISLYPVEIIAKRCVVATIMKRRDKLK